MAKIFQTYQHCQQEYEVGDGHECSVNLYASTRAKSDPVTAPMPNPFLTKNTLDAIFERMYGKPIGPDDDNARRAAALLGVELTGEWRLPRDGETWLWGMENGEKVYLGAMSTNPQVGNDNLCSRRYIVRKPHAKTV